MERSDYIIVSMTTWMGRIGNLSHIIELVMGNTMLPDKVCVNLSVEDFPGREEDFPEELNKVIERYKETVEIHWLFNDTRVWKKLIPTLCRYREAVVVSIDDDWEYPDDIIETLYGEYCRNGKRFPVTGGRCVFRGLNCHCGCCSLTTYGLLNGRGQFDMLTEECMRGWSDDIFYTYSAYVNDNPYVCSPRDFPADMAPFNQERALGKAVRVSRTYTAAQRAIMGRLKTNILGFICKEALPRGGRKIEGIEVVSNFAERDEGKMWCVLGVLKTELGLEIEKEMVGWLSERYDVISVRQEAPGVHFEYPAIDYAFRLARERGCDVLYLHTKGAAHNKPKQRKTRNMWRDEFVGEYDKYRRLLEENRDRPSFVCPYTGEKKITWFNGFFVNSRLAEVFEVPYSEDRYDYEMLFCDTFINAVKGVDRDVDTSGLVDRLVKLRG